MRATAGLEQNADAIVSSLKYVRYDKCGNFVKLQADKLREALIQKRKNAGPQKAT
jgi:hypothetical protein